MDAELVAPRAKLGRKFALKPLKRSTLIAYLVPIGVALIVSQTWFRAGHTIAEGDVPPPLAPSTDYMVSWNAADSGEGTPSYRVVEVPYYEFLRGFHRLELSEALAQRLWLTGLFVGVAAAATFFVLSLGISALGGVLAGIVAILNPYWLVERLNPIPKASFILAGVLGGLIVRAAVSHWTWRRVLLFGLVSGGLGFSFANPPHFVLVITWVIFSAVLVGFGFGFRAFLRATRMLATALPLVILANLWWAIQALQRLRSPDFVSTFAAPGPLAWTWTHTRATVPNALGLNTTWAWGYPEYFPFSVRLDRFPWVWMRFAFIGLAVLSIVWVSGRARRYLLPCWVALVATVFVAKGLNQPLASASAWLYAHVPGAWLFREPSKVLLVALLLVCTLAAITVASRSAGSEGVQKAKTYALLAMLGIGIAYVHPLFTGSLIPHKRPLLPSAYVAVPAEWKQLAAHLNARKDGGKLLVLPLADFYQLPTKWGYYGASFTNLLVNRPVFDPAPGGYFNSAGSVNSVLAQIEEDILDGNGRRFLAAARSLGVSFILVRGDLDVHFPGRSLKDPERLEAGLAQIEGSTRAASFGNLVLYQVDGAGSPAYVASPALYWGHGSGIVDVVGPDGKAAAVVSDPKQEARGAGGVLQSAGGTFQVYRLGRERLVQLKASGGGGALTLELTDPLKISVGSVSLPPMPTERIQLPVRAGPLVLSVGSREFHFPRVPAERDLGLLRIPSGGLVRVQQVPAAADRVPVEATRKLSRWGDNPLLNINLPRGSVPVSVSGPLLKRNSVPAEAFGPVEDCNRFDAQTLEEAGLSKRLVEEDGVSVLELSAWSHAACVRYQIPSFDPTQAYEVSFDYRAVAGTPPRACIWLTGPDECAAAPSLNLSSLWSRFRTVVTPPKGAAAMTLYLYADGDRRGVSANAYRNIEISPTAQVELALVKTESNAVSADFLKLSRPGPTKLSGTLDGSSSGSKMIVLTEAYSDGWRMSIDGKEVDSDRHVIADGYANGWIVPLDGARGVEFSYRPEGLARVARLSSAAFLGILLISVVTAFVNAARKPRGESQAANSEGARD